ncbi:hypothetical protein FHW88_002597 [Mucilaginibacter sp. SG538B]|uniref:hypothetical protein n=1 Tax=Mucilaginibacter sp. SG538B TaxID=2587021 RepID=UPI00159E02C8|nr:hypothetical protein [Mucilaginibacter sp. SG538B]NVM64308.1 hypothetical protein [Mucilaginibacter sp. SG538B]
MKKQLLWGAALLLSGLTACKKNDFGSNQANTSKTIKTNVAAPNYVELQPYPNVPGTYFATYGQAPLVISGLYYDTRQYPTFKEGIPAFGSVSIPGPDYMHSVVTEEGYSTGKSFVVTATYQSATNYQAIHNDLVRYYKAVDQWIAESAIIDMSPPIMRDYIKTSYTASGSQIVATSGKLITITTGSKWAIATGDYKIPKPIVAEHMLGAVNDPLNSNIVYYLYGLNGNITRISTNAQSATGTYTATANPNVNTVTVTIKRTNGTTFQLTQQNTIDLT